jgi:hypothetical protein
MIRTACSFLKNKQIQGHEDKDNVIDFVFWLGNGMHGIYGVTLSL